MSRVPAFQVRVTTALGVVHAEGQSDDLAEADRYARNAIADYCLSAEVLAVCAKGYMPGTVVSRWDPARFAAWTLDQLDW